jgi:hypothetical protein
MAFTDGAGCAFVLQYSICIHPFLHDWHVSEVDVPAVAKGLRELRAQLAVLTQKSAEAWCRQVYLKVRVRNVFPGLSSGVPDETGVLAFS